MSNVFTRRHFLGLAAGSCTMAAAGALGGCTFDEPLLRIGAHPWPGYEMLYLAREKGWLDQEIVRLVEMPSASDSIQALFAGALEGAALTLDEVMSVAAAGLDLKVVAVLDISLGADVLLAQSRYHSLLDLRGRRIGVENSATGALMLEGALTAAGLAIQDIVPVYMTIDKHHSAFLAQEVDAIVTYDPVRSQLLAVGARMFFDSSMIHGQIVDVLALRGDVLTNHRAALQQLVAAHFHALQEMKRNPVASAKIIASRLNLKPEEVSPLYDVMDMPDLIANQAWLGGGHPKLDDTVRLLQDVMRRYKLLPAKPVSVSFADAQYLPREVS